MDEDQILRLKISFDDKVYLTDKEFKAKYSKHPWMKMGHGGEHNVYRYGRDLVIKAPVEYEDSPHGIDDTQPMSVFDKEIDAFNFDNHIFPSHSVNDSWASERDCSDSVPSKISSHNSSRLRGKPSEIEDIGHMRYKRFSRELTLPKSEYLTTTIAVSPNFSVEEAKQTDLDEYMIKLRDNPASMKTRLEWCLHMYKGLLVIHDSKYTHLDLKPENIFVKDGILSIGDFGSLHPITTSEKHATRQWGLPSESTRNAMEIDMFSMALISIGILTWNSSIIFKCRDFTVSLSKAKNLDGMCKTLGDLLTHSCMEKFEAVDPDLVSELRCSILGAECDGSCVPDAFGVIRVLTKIIRSAPSG